MAYIYRSCGTTKSERKLAKLCDRSFLNLWSYPNLYVDKGRKKVTDAGKELCDLLVVCENYVIIFSDKDIKFQVENVELGWRRWVKKAIVKSSKQINGAENIILNYPNKIFLDSKCTEQFPLKIPSKDKIILHKIIVAIGTNEACKNYWKDETGSFIIECGSSKNINMSYEDWPVFTVGDINQEGSYTHIFDEFSLNLLLKEFDTITDFSRYLSKREKLMRCGKEILITGEEELASIYLQNTNDFGEHDFIINGKRLIDHDSTGILIDKGFWKDLSSHPQYVAKKQADSISYLWDTIINKFTDHIIEGTSITASSCYNVQELEIPVRKMALERRVNRRLLSQGIADAISNSPDHNLRMARFFIPSDEVTFNIPYIFMLFPRPPIDRGISDENFRIDRRNTLYAYCLCFMQKYHSKYNEIVGIATDYPNTVDGLYSEDAIYFNCQGWNDDLDNETNDYKNKFDIFKDDRFKFTKIGTKEYPEIEVSKGSIMTMKAKKRRKELKKKKSKRH